MYAEPPKRKIPNPVARKLPHSTEIERAFLGGLMLAPERLADVRALIVPEDLHRPQHQALYQAFCAASDAGGQCDIITMGDAITAAPDPDRYGGIAYVLALPAHCPSPENLDWWAEQLRGLTVRRRMILAGWGIVDEATQSTKPEDLIAYASTAVADASSLASAAHEPAPIGEGLLDVYEAMLTRQAEREAAEAEGRVYTVGIPTGLPALDALARGGRPGELIFVAGRPGMGKTAFALGLTLAALQEGQGVLFVSLEMTREELYERILANVAQVYYDRITEGRLETRDRDRIGQAMEYLSALPLYVDDQAGVQFAAIRSRAQALQRKRGLGMIVVDYIQLIGVVRKNGMTTNDLTADLSKGLKQLAKELRVPVVALAQLNRKLEDRSDKRPQPADLRDSGSLEQDADKILFLYRDEVYNPDTLDKGIAEVIVAKHRGGKTGTARVAWNGAFQRFSELR